MCLCTILFPKGFSGRGDMNRLNPFRLNNNTLI